MFNDKIPNWYEKTKAPKRYDPSKDKYWKNTYLIPTAHILAIAPNGYGKTQVVMEYIHRRGGEFGKVIIFQGVQSDEYLYNNLLTKNPQIQYFTNIDELPTVTDICESEDFDKTDQHLIIFDDFMGVPEKKLAKMIDWITAGRKLGFTCYLLAQDYTKVHPIIRRNVSYLFIGKQNDKNNLKYILNTHSFGVPKNEILKLYKAATKVPPDFFMIDLKTTDPKMQFRHNFTDFMGNEINEDEEEEKPKTRKK